MSVGFVPARARRGPFGIVPLSLAGMRWNGSAGPEEFRPVDYKIYPHLAYMVETADEFPGARDLAASARVGISAVYAFLERLERSGVGRIDRDGNGWIVAITLEEPSEARAGVEGLARAGVEGFGPKRAPVWKVARAGVEGSARRCVTLLLESSKDLKIGSEAEPGAEPESDPIRSDRLRSQESENPPQATQAAPPPLAVEEDEDIAFDPPAAQLAAWRLQVADFRHGSAEGRSAAAAGLARFARATAARRKAKAAVVPAPSSPAPPPVRGGAPDPIQAPSPPSGRCAIETLFTRVANPDGFPDDAVIDEAAERLHETLGDKDDVKPYRDVMEELRAGMVKLADVHEAMRCSRGSQARRRPATFFWSINKVRPWARKGRGDC